MAAALIVGAGLAVLVTLDLGPVDVPGPPVTQAPTVEFLRSPDARMVDLRVFEEDEEVMELVLIFDEGIDL